jgi:hypothetical protein
MPLLATGVKLARVGGSRGFFRKPLADLNKVLCRQTHAMELAAIDADILDHPTLDHYVQRADDLYRAKADEQTYQKETTEADNLEVFLSLSSNLEQSLIPASGQYKAVGKKHSSAGGVFSLIPSLSFCEASKSSPTVGYSRRSLPTYSSEEPIRTAAKPLRINYNRFGAPIPPDSS